METIKKSKVKLAIISTHPIQYYAPIFSLLGVEETVQLKVFYTWGKESTSKFDPGFKKEIEWDIPLLNGYDYEFLPNTSKNPGSHGFMGIINPSAISKIAQFKPNVILVIGWSYHSHLQIMRHFNGKVAIWFRGDSTLLDRKKGVKGYLMEFFKKRILCWVYSYVDKVFYVGSNNKAYFLNHSVRESQLVFTPHAVDNRRFSLDRSSEAALLRQKLRIEDDDVVILFSGKFERKKAPLLLLDAFNDLDSKNVHLLFTGNGVLEKELKHKSKLGKAAERIHFLGFQNQRTMPVVYQACNVFCLPSAGPGETWGLAVNEAMAAGKAVLVSDKVGCANDLVKPGINGYIFAAGDKDDLCAKLRILCDIETANSFGEESKKIIKQWSFERILTTFIQELNK